MYSKELFGLILQEFDTSLLAPTLLYNLVDINPTNVILQLFELLLVINIHQLSELLLLLVFNSPHYYIPTRPIRQSLQLALLVFS